MPNSTLHAKSKIALVEAEWAHFTTARSEHAARRVMAAHLLLRYALIVCLFFVPVKGTAALFAYAQKSGMQRQPVCAIHRRAANCSSMCRHWQDCRSRPPSAVCHHRRSTNRATHYPRSHRRWYSVPHPVCRWCRRKVVIRSNWPNHNLSLLILTNRSRNS